MSTCAEESLEIETSAEPLPGHLALPARGSGRGVLVVHDAGGLDAALRSACGRLARAGYVALAPDLYRGAPPEGREQAAARLAKLDREEVADALVAAVAALLGHHAVDGGRVAALGFGAGAALAELAAQRSERVGALASLGAESPPELADRPLLAVSPVEAGAREGFLDEGRPDRHDPAAADRVWGRLLAFLGEALA